MNMDPGEFIAMASIEDSDVEILFIQLAIT